MNRKRATISTATVTICTHAKALRPQKRSFDLSVEYSSGEMWVVWLRVVSPKVNYCDEVAPMAMNVRRHRIMRSDWLCD